MLTSLDIRNQDPASRMSIKLFQQQQHLPKSKYTFSAPHATRPHVAARVPLDCRPRALSKAWGNRERIQTSAHLKLRNMFPSADNCTLNTISALFLSHISDSIEQVVVGAVLGMAGWDEISWSQRHGGLTLWKTSSRAGHINARFYGLPNFIC